MLKTLRQRNFSLLWFAGLISITGNWMLFIALPVLVYTMTGSVLAVGGMLLAQTLPGILFSSVAGVFVDRWERKRTIVIVNLLLAVSILPLLLVRSEDWLWLVYIVVFVQSTLGKFFAPAENAFLPLLSDPKLLPSANALNSLNNNLGRLIGPALGGLIAAQYGLEGVVLIDALTYLAAAGLAVLINVTSHPGKAEITANSLSLRRVADEWVDGLRLIWREQTIRVLFIYHSVISIGESVMYVLFVPFVTEVLGGDSVHVGGLMSAQAVGGVIGGVLISQIAPRIKPYKMLAFGSILLGLCDLMLFNYSTFFTGIFLAYGMLVLAGPFSVGIGTGYQTLFQENTADGYRGRVFGTFGLTISTFTLLGIALTGVASERFGIVPVINVQSYVYIFGGLLCIVALRARAENATLASSQGL